MTLRAIVIALGGELYQNGCRANVPGPGHSAADRSVSLLLEDGRVLIHTFGATDWRAAHDDLRRRGLIDAQGRPTSGSAPTEAPPRPSRASRSAAAARFWEGALPITATSPAGLYLRRRAVGWAGSLASLRFHPRMPVSVYAPRTDRTRPALVARVSDDHDRTTAIEITYLAANGQPALDVLLKRKTVGRVPPGAAVRLGPAAARMLVGEGVITTLSAMRRFALPGWALRSAHNLAVWTPPAGVDAVLIAGDRGAVGETVALRLRARLVAQGLEACIAVPELPFGDWNEVEAAEIEERREEGRDAAPVGRGWTSSPDGELP
jgi:putative DNA primase/helicase